ncbi:MAG TPA: tRNA 2-thiouridine(34) synthase MnmA [Actinomycetes bacterium]|nr:tRNA 2-thiouridine(34) synthase MnmA [Actinomycetes bacterium]
MTRVLAAMSGGVDSSVAAALAADAGWDVTGVHLKLADTPAHLQVQGKGCCTLADAEDARRVADVIGIPFYVWDMAEEFGRAVVDDFAAEYARGRTPNPCARCNERVKVVGLLARARALGFDALVTGHYARVAAGRLYRAADRAKDQSYVLYMLGPDELAGLRLPLGGLRKSRVRAIAAAKGLRTAAKAESYDVCFVPDGDTAGWLERRLGRRPGQVVDAAGQVLGSHQGAYRFTVGQRRGLGVAAPTPRYVLRVEPAAARVVVGERGELAIRAVELEGATGTGGHGLAAGRARVRLRAHGAEVGCQVVPLGGGRARLDLDEPADAVAPGQAGVLYDGDLVLGGGTVARTVPAALAGRESPPG